MKYKIANKKERNERIRKYAARFPGMTQAAIAKIFHVSQPIVNKALKERSKDDGE